MASNAKRDEVYILSLPAFVWFKANYTSVDPRIYHTCHIAGNQMLSIGGLNPSFDSFATAQNDTDLFWEGIKVFDLTALEWTNYYNANSPAYTPSKPISDYYGGESQYPTWSLPAVENLFVGRTPSEPSPSPTTHGKGITPHQKELVGGTVGGVGGLLVSIACVVLFLVRKKRKKHREEREATGRLPGEHESGQRQVPGGLYEAECMGQPAEAGPGEPGINELDNGKPIPQEMPTVPLSHLFELGDSRRNDHHDHTSIPVELG